MRRGNSADSPVSYGSVGMTQQADIIAFPPPGFAAAQSSWRIGSGEERFEIAQASLLTWGLQRAAHLRVEVLQDGDASGYQGLEFNGSGFSRANSLEPEVSYTPEGVAYIQPGTIVRVAGLWSPVERSQDFRVIYVIRESKQVGFGLGTLDETPVVGEEYFGIEWRDDDSVWAIVRSVSQIPESRWKWALTPAIRLRQALQLRANVRALSPARQA
jgi:uncharacterized protein (UPF0548 family)